MIAMDYTKIIDHLYLGSCPRTNSDIATLHRAGLSAVLNFQTDEDQVYASIDWPRVQVSYRSHGVEVRRVPVRDSFPKDFTAKLPQCAHFANFSMPVTLFICIATLWNSRRSARTADVDILEKTLIEPT